MAMLKYKCPHCGSAQGPVAVNPNASRSKAIASCQHCHKPIYVIKENGKVKAIKR